MPRYIPPEVTDITISFVPDASTLCKCCLVCRGWVPASRCRLFEEISLKSEDQYDLFVSCVLRSSTMRPWLSFITSLSMFLPLPSDGEDKIAGKCARGVFFYELTGQLPNLERLALFNLFWDRKNTYMHHRMFTALYGFSSVRQLEILNCRFPSFGLFRRMITALRQLTRLYLCLISWPVPVPPQETTLLSHIASLQPLPLSTLNLYSCISPEFMYHFLLAMTTSLSTLTHFTTGTDCNGN